ncbi:MAG: TfoX/Sxy family protein [Treponema sp.]|nr:TfoX/Sxy family protein [Treponema sp.]
MAELISMMNIGAEIEKKLKAVEIATAEDLKKAGSKEAFLRLKAKYPNVCLVHLYTLEGAVSNIPFDRLPEETKRNLKDFSDSLK